MGQLLGKCKVKQGLERPRKKEEANNNVVQVINEEIKKIYKVWKEIKFMATNRVRNPLLHVG